MQEAQELQLSKEASQGQRVGALDARRLRLDRGQAAGDGPRLRRELVGEGIVAAGVEDRKPELARTIDRVQHMLHRHRLETDIAI